MPITIDTALDLKKQLQGFCRSRRALSSAQARLVYDALVLVSGLRPVVMLDYVNIQPADAIAVAKIMTEVTGVLCFAMTLDGLMYLASLRRLQQHLSDLTNCSAEQPLLLTPISAPEGTNIAILEHDQTKVILHSLEPLLQNVTGRLEALRMEPCPSHSSKTSMSSSQLESASNSHHHDLKVRSDDETLRLLDLSCISGLPLMPTLNGLLLGYPLVYYVPSMESAGTLTRLLSCTNLILCQICVASSVLNDEDWENTQHSGKYSAVQNGNVVAAPKLRACSQETGMQAGSKDESAGSVQILAACSVPEEDWNALVQGHVKRWFLSIAEMSEKSQILWLVPELREKRMEIQPVFL